MMNVILSVAESDERVRAVILNGSRANPKIMKDDFQDFDVIYLVKELESFRVAPHWIDVFGERIILQMPNAMNIDGHDWEAEKNEITYLMLFKDFNRIDLKLIEVKDKALYKDRLNKILLDKDNLLQPNPNPSDRDYWVSKPTQKDFKDCCNEFWWVTTYVVKGLARNEMVYAKEMLEVPVRKMFLRMLSWFVGKSYGFNINLGNSYRFLQKYVSPQMWEAILKTYPDANKTNIWNSLMEMTRIFNELASSVADELGLDYHREEAQNVIQYLRDRAQRILS